MARTEPVDAEQLRLEEARSGKAPWKAWGPYLSERQWGTVREDVSQDGTAWDSFSHDQARSRAYRWGEDGLAGISDDKQRLCFALALWNGRDPIVKERLFGLTNGEGNHGEDVKEYYFYLDSTPTHSYMKYLYKYPQAAFPYDDLVKTNRERSRQEREYELLDTGVFDQDRYFDVFVEYAKAAPDDLLIRLTICNRGPDPAPLHLLPTLWFRNTWSAEDGASRPLLERKAPGVIVAHPGAPDPERPQSDWFLCFEGTPELLFTENETNTQRLSGQPNASPYVKDGINDFLVQGKKEAVNPAGRGTKVSVHHTLTVGAGATETVRLRLKAGDPGRGAAFTEFDRIFEARAREADRFFDGITPPAVRADPDRARVMRQALAGMLWSKQYFHYDVARWLREHAVTPGALPVGRRARNAEWFHMVNDDVISMPDKWEYPWYAAWDLAFHTIPLAMVDPDFAKSQLGLMLRNEYLHPNGQMPAYEWNFGDVNPPVHAHATMQVYLIDKERNHGQGDLAFLAAGFGKLQLNFTWWLNRKDRTGNNLFEGGFLGLDNIGVFDRSAPLPTGGYLEQADGTAWMAFFSQQMLRIAVELALHDPAYEEYASRFFEHTLWIAAAMDRVGEHADEMWDEEDGFFYDVLRLPSGTAMRLKVRSMVGLLPLAAVAIFEEDILARLPSFGRKVRSFLQRHPELTANIHLPGTPGAAGRRMVSILNEKNLRRVLGRMLDEKEFLGPHGIRALSRYHLEHPYIFRHEGQEFRVSYVPGDSDTQAFGGNSNWRGPVWMPVNVMLWSALFRLGAFYGDSFTVECPTGSGKQLTLFAVAHELGERLIRTFLKDDAGRRPVYGDVERFQSDPNWRDNLLFYEYFHGDSGAGVGASHQTGWTGAIARIIQTNSALTEDRLDARNVEQVVMEVARGR